MTFLQYVAKDILAKHGEQNLSDIAIVFPNKRASLFLNQALYEEAKQPLWSPTYITISDLFRNHSDLKIPDQISLIFRLYNVYQQKTGSAESLDHFYSWGQLMLSDFDDIDKNMAEADKLFIDIDAWQNMKDFTFLTEEQRKSLEEFFGAMMDRTELQQKFSDIWKNLGPIYHAYRKELRSRGEAYEGMLYREVSEKELNNFHYKKYIFVGFNLLQKVEQKLFAQLMDMDKAEFYWDYDEYYLGNKHEAGRYIAENIKRFPNELSVERASKSIDVNKVYRNFKEKKQITYISAHSENVQARYISNWLEENERKKDGRKTAIVLSDEQLLQSAIHCFPQDVTAVNITTGYPLSASPICSLISALVDLQLKGRADDDLHYRLKYVNRILTHPYAKYISDNCKLIYDDLNTHKQYYPSIEYLISSKDENIKLIFDGMQVSNDIIAILPWISKVLQQVGLGAQEYEDALLHESIFRMYTLMQRLDDIMVVKKGDHIQDVENKEVVSTIIFQRLLNQLIDSTSVPFHGEPAIGIQLMGVLETRNLDFEHILLLSCNEGNLPKGINDASFIPHVIRKGYELTTIENKIAIYAYYFYSLLQRANDITLVYNNATDDSGQGEMSRFMLQYLVENKGYQNIIRKTLLSGQTVTTTTQHPIEKSEAIQNILDKITTLSPTAIGRYLRCNLQFFYYSICNLRENSTDDAEEIDNSTFGNIFHKAAQYIYKHLSGSEYSNIITKEKIKACLKDSSMLSECLDQAFREELFNVKDSRFVPKYNGLQLLNRKVLKAYLTRLLKYDQLNAPLKILALEEDFSAKMAININGKEKELTLRGQVDRLDQVIVDGKETIRVVDYKTGSPSKSTPSNIEDIFNPQNIEDKHTDYYLQAFLYAYSIRRDPESQASVNRQNLPVSPALLFIRKVGTEDYNPTLTLKTDDPNGGKTTKLYPINDIEEVADDFCMELRKLLEEIFDPSIPFSPTDNKKRCEYCPYADLCGI
jgi:hypothetical protein